MDTMNASDAVLWAIERDPKLRSTVTAVAMLDRPPDMDRLHHRVEAAVGAFPRLRKKVAEPPLGIGHPRWTVDPDFVLERHLHAVDAVIGDAGADDGGPGDAGPGGPRRLFDLASSMAEDGFDRSAPLWEIVVVEHLEGGKAALVQKFHHSLIDGMGGIELLLSLLDWSRHPRHELDLPPVGDESGDGPWSLVAEQAAYLRRAVSGIPPLFVRSATNPVGAVADGWRTGQSIARLLTPATTPLSPVFGPRSTRWRFDIHEETMDALHAAAGAAEGTVNDAFLAAVANGLHRYHLEHGRPVHGLRMNLPVSFRRTGDPVAGNRWTPVRFVVPVDEPDPRKRIRQLGDLCRRWRHEPALPLTEGIADVLSRLPDQATTVALGSMMYGVDFVATNVPGVAKRSYIAGSQVTRQFAFAPLGGAAVNFSLVSHAGTACIGVNTDRVAVPDPELLMDCLRGGFAEVVALAG